MRYPHIAIRRGVPYVGNVPVNRLWFWYSNDVDIERIVQRYEGRLSRSQVYTAISFAINHPYDVDTPEATAPSAEQPRVRPARTGRQASLRARPSAQLRQHLRAE